jgi:hypothetical protein
MTRTLVRTAFLLVLVALSAAPAFAGPVTLRFSGELRYVLEAADAVQPWEEVPPEWPDITGLDTGMPYELTVTYEADTPGVNLFSDVIRYYEGAVSSAVFEVGPYSYTASDGDIFTNYGLPYGIGPDAAIVGLGQVQFQFGPELWSQAPGTPEIWNGNMILSYNDVGAFDGALPSSLQFAPFQGLQSLLLWEHRPAAGGGPFFEGPHTVVEQIAPVPEPATWALFGAGLALLAVRHIRR